MSYIFENIRNYEVEKVNEFFIQIKTNDYYRLLSYIKSSVDEFNSITTLNYSGLMEVPYRVYDEQEMKFLTYMLRRGEDTSYYEDSNFYYTYGTFNEMNKAIESGIDVVPYLNNKKYPAGKLRTVFKILNIDPKVNVDDVFGDLRKLDFYQLQEITSGFEEGYDVSLYNDTERYNSAQMKQVHQGLRDGVNVSLYNDPKRYKSGQMEQIRRGLNHNIDVSLYNDPRRYSARQMKQLRKGIEAGLDVSLFNDPEKYNDKEMKNIRLEILR